MSRGDVALLVFCALINSAALLLAVASGDSLDWLTVGNGAGLGLAIGGLLYGWNGVTR